MCGYAAVIRKYYYYTNFQIFALYHRQYETLRLCTTSYLYIRTCYLKRLYVSFPNFKTHNLNFWRIQSLRWWAARPHADIARLPTTLIAVLDSLCWLKACTPNIVWLVSNQTTYVNSIFTTHSFDIAWHWSSRFFNEQFESPITRLMNK